LGESKWSSKKEKQKVKIIVIRFLNAPINIMRGIVLRLDIFLKIIYTKDKIRKKVCTDSVAPNLF